MTYTDTDHRFDAENLNGPCCPVHGRAGCDCCPECGCPSGRHTQWCVMADDDCGGSSPTETAPEPGELQYPEPTAEQRAEAAELRQRARDCARSRQESIARSGVSDGFLSQWASDLSAREYNAKAELLEQGGVEIFEGLYRRSDGKRVRAKLISGKYGPCWAFCDQQGKFTGRFLGDSKGTKRSKLYREGFEKRDELAPAYAKITGSGTGLSGASTCYVAVRRSDGGYPEDAVVE